MRKRQLLEAIDDWMVNYKKTSVKPATYDRLVTSRDMLARYDISEIPIDKLEIRDLQQYVNELVADGYALTTIRKQFHLIGSFIDHENLMGEMSRPLHKGVKLPTETTVKKHRKEVIAYDHDEQRALKNVLWRGDSPAYYAALIMMETGMRVGEVLALSWSDVDWRRKCVRISKTFVRLGNAKQYYVQNSAKSVSSNRTIPLSKDAYEAFSRLKERDEFDNGMVFHNARGGIMSYETLRWWIRKACDEAGVPYYGQHVFRHTFATNCYERGCDVKLLSKFLGHSDVMITYNVYIHLYGDALEEMRSVLG